MVANEKQLSEIIEPRTELVEAAKKAAVKIAARAKETDQ